MSRLPSIPSRELSTEQREVHGEIASRRNGRVSGPFEVWLRRPGLARAAHLLGDALRSDGVERRLFELAVLVVSRHWQAAYPWAVHVRHARSCGTTVSVLDALAHDVRPTFSEPDEEVVYVLTRELLETGTLADDTYKRAEDLLGTDALIQLVTVVGFYSSASLVTNAFGVEPGPDLLDEGG